MQVPPIATAIALLLSAAASAYEASVSVDPARPLGAISPYIYGQYLEHVDAVDECIYPSIWDDTSPFADSTGVRRDVMDAARALGAPILRWPGGCFADAYHWENGVGPREHRPLWPNLHWKGTMESHQFGTDEFLHFCEQTGSAPYINVNLGSGTLDEALRWLEYCNGAPETEQGKRRGANGRVKPYDVLHWGIGNETWGSWELGHTDAKTYSRELVRWAKAMRAKDPRIQILAVGSEQGGDPAWDEAVLRAAGDVIDYLTFHIYGTAMGAEGEWEKVAFSPLVLENRMRAALRTIDAAAGERARHIRLSVDEWNIRRYDKNKILRRAPRDLQDAVFTAGVLNAMIRLSPRVGMANYVFLVNGHAPLLVNREQVVRTPLFEVFQRYRSSMRGTALPVQVQAPRTQPPNPQLMGPTYKMTVDHHAPEAPWLDAAAARQEDGTLVFALINRHATESAEVSLHLPAEMSARTVWTLHDADLKAANTFAEPERVRGKEEAVAEGVRAWTCPPHSIVFITCKTTR